jgi:hypothetical protein
MDLKKDDGGMVGTLPGASLILTVGGPVWSVRK